MTLNESTWDRVVRILVGLALSTAAWITWPANAAILSSAGFVSFVLFVAGIEVFATGVAGWSPLYALLGFSTRETVSA